jgi:hypothetical protein
MSALPVGKPAGQPAAKPPRAESNLEQIQQRGLVPRTVQLDIEDRSRVYPSRLFAVQESRGQSAHVPLHRLQVQQTSRRAQS